MNNLYHRFAVTSVSIALGFALGVNKEVQAATLTLTNASGFFISDRNLDGVADWAYGGAIPLPVGLERDENSREYLAQHRAFYEFNLASLSLAPDTVIKSAVFQTTVNSVEWNGSYFQLQAYGYRKNERDDFSSLFDAGEYLDYNNVGLIIMQGDEITFNVLPFINQRIRNNDSFAGFGIRGSMGDEFLRDKAEGHIYLNSRASLTITTEPVPEPTTIFGSAIGLCLGGWLKRRKSALQNKTTSQN
jgi:hypothetical protein